MAIDKLIDDILRREGGAKATNDPKDRGGRTQYGISEKSNPAAWADGVVTEAEAREIYRKKYLEGPGFDRISEPQLQALLVDWGVNSGPRVAIKGLQRALNITDDGVLGPNTLARLAGRERELLPKVVAERIKMVARVVAANPSQVKFLVGWINRCCEFL